MLRPADLLVLDEPTNDLDIPTLEVLEESLIGFPGALVLVSHDRQLINRVTTEILALDGLGGTQRYADYDQWQAERRAVQAPKKCNATAERPTAPKHKARRLSYLEQREFDAMEQKILAAELRVDEARTRTEDPSIAADAASLQERFQDMADAQSEVDRLYERWAGLEAMLG